MMPLDTPNLRFLRNKEPLNETTTAAKNMLEKLQGNILKGHGRDFGVYILFRFRDDPAVVKKDLAELSKYVTSAYKQYQEAEAYRKFKRPGSLFGMIVLSADGYRYLGYDPATTFHERRPD